MTMNKLLCCVILMAWVLIPPAFAAEEGLKTNQAPVTLTSDSFEADEAAGTLIFIGNAVAKQEDITVHADRLTLFYSSETQEIVKIVAEGHVRIDQERRQATGDKAVFDRIAESIVLTGHPRVSEKGSSVEGQVITLFLKDRRSIVEGGEGGRVNAVFQPKAKRAP